MCRVSSRRLFIYNFEWGLLKATKNVKVKQTKIHMGSIRQSLQAQPKNIKKLSKHQIYQSNRKISQKTLYFIPSKCKGAKNSYGGYPTEFAGSTQNVKKK
jgi:hypothetical protein